MLLLSFIHVDPCSCVCSYLCCVALHCVPMRQVIYPILSSINTGLLQGFCYHEQCSGAQMQNQLQVDGGLKHGRQSYAMLGKKYRRPSAWPLGRKELPKWDSESTHHKGKQWWTLIQPEVDLLGVWPWAASPEPTSNPSQQGWWQTARRPAGDKRSSCFAFSPMPDFVRIFHFYKSSRMMWHFLGALNLHLPEYSCLSPLHLFTCYLVTFS